MDDTSTSASSFERKRFIFYIFAFIFQTYHSIRGAISCWKASCHSYYFFKVLHQLLRHKRWNALVLLVTVIVATCTTFSVRNWKTTAQLEQEYNALPIDEKKVAVKPQPSPTSTLEIVILSTGMFFAPWVATMYMGLYGLHPVPLLVMGVCMGVSLPVLVKESGWNMAMLLVNFIAFMAGTPLLIICILTM